VFLDGPTKPDRAAHSLPTGRSIYGAVKKLAARPVTGYSQCRNRDVTLISPHPSQCELDIVATCLYEHSDLRSTSCSWRVTLAVPA